MANINLHVNGTIQLDLQGITTVSHDLMDLGATITSPTSSSGSLITSTLALPKSDQTITVMGSEDMSDFWFTHGGVSPVMSYEAPDTTLRSWGAMIGYLQPTCADPQYSWHPRARRVRGRLSAGRHMLPSRCSATTHPRFQA